MPETNDITPNPFIAHVEAKRRADALSCELERMDCDKLAGMPVDPQRYAEVERAWEAASDECDALDDAFLASPFGVFDSIKYRNEQITRIAEIDPKRGAAYCRQLADQLEALA